MFKTLTLNNLKHIRFFTWDQHNNGNLHKNTLEINCKCGFVSDKSTESLQSVACFPKKTLISQKHNGLGLGG